MALGVTRGKSPSQLRRERHRPSRHPWEPPPWGGGRPPASAPRGARLGASLLSKEGGPIIVWTRFCSLRRDRGPLLGVALGSRGNFIYLFLLFSFCNPISFSFSVSSQELG